MTKQPDTSVQSSTGVRNRRLAVLAVLAAAGTFLSCGGNLFSPAFVDLLDPSGVSASIQNPPGHVVIAFSNNATVDERLLNYMKSAAGGNLSLTPFQEKNLHPRVRFRMLVTFVNGNQTSFEFISGSTYLVDPRFNAQAEVDLNQNTLENTVVLCNVSRVELLPGSFVEAFIPVTLRGYRFREQDNVVIGGQPIVVAELVAEIPPHFEPLGIDVLDVDGNVVVQGNIDVQQQLPPVRDPGCGAVIAIIMSGVLDVPFLEGVDNNPSYNVDDVFQTARIGGRYAFQVSIR